MAKPSEAMTIFDLDTARDAGPAQSARLRDGSDLDSAVVRAVWGPDHEVRLANLARVFAAPSAGARHLIRLSGVEREALPELLRLEAIREESSLRFRGGPIDTQTQFRTDFRPEVLPQ
jgi:hypothetical protein